MAPLFKKGKIDEGQAFISEHNKCLHLARTLVLPTVKIGVAKTKLKFFSVLEQEIQMGYTYRDIE